MIASNLKVGMSPDYTISGYQFTINEFKKGRLASTIRTNKSYPCLQIHTKVNIVIYERLKEEEIVNKGSCNI